MKSCSLAYNQCEIKWEKGSKGGRGQVRLPFVDTGRLGIGVQVDMPLEIGNGMVVDGIKE